METIDTKSVSLPLYVDSTMIRTFKSCPQKFYLEFVRLSLIHI